MTDDARPMTDGEILEVMGTDAAKWTDEFLRINPDLNIPDAWGVMVGWFANAIESGRSAGWKAHEQKIREEPRPSYPPSAADLD